MPWAPEKIETLKTLWSKGFSATQIAQEIGGTRSAILGQIHRMRQYEPELFSRRRLENGQRRPKKYKPVPRQIRKPREIISYERPVEFVPVVVELPALNLSIFDLAQNSCRYPVTEDSPFLYCGHAQQKDSSYCAAHHRVCYAKPQQISDEERDRRAQRARQFNAKRQRVFA